MADMEFIQTLIRRLKRKADVMDVSEGIFWHSSTRKSKKKDKGKVLHHIQIYVLLQTLYQIFATGFCMMNVPGISALF